MIKIILLIIGIILTCLTVALLLTGKSNIASIISAIFAFLSFFVSLNPNFLNQNKIIPSIVLNNNYLELIRTDEYILEATITPNNCIVNWNSDNEEIVTIDYSGHLKTINEGNATITATIAYKNIEYTDTCIIKVSRPIINIDFSDIFYVGDTKSLSLYTLPKEANVI
ncbi:MAG: Ig-like domain-containing protein [Acetatifactor sp.]|nr:Ig-like domain-containing protein [Acetatifactor sp.]